MGKSHLHEILAVEADLKGKFNVITNETAQVFSKKPALFSGFIRSLSMFQEDGIGEDVEHQALTTTVDEKLAYAQKTIVQYFDVLAQKEATNQVAVADIVIGDKVLATNVPATMLLSLESKLKDLRHIYESIPTLAMGIDWVADPASGVGIFKTVHPEVKMKTKKAFQHQVLYEATDKHPAVIEKWEEQVDVGRYSKTYTSGCVTPTRKAEMLDRFDQLAMAVKKARQTANRAETVSVNYGQELMNFVNKG